MLISVASTSKYRRSRYTIHIYVHTYVRSTLVGMGCKVLHKCVLAFVKDHV